MDRQYSIPHSSRLLTRTHKKGEAKPDEKDRFQHIMPVCVYRDVSDGNKEEEGRRAPHRKPPTPPLFHPLRLPLFIILFFPSFLQLELREAFSFVRVNFGRIAVRFSSFTSLFPIPSGFPICICFFKCSSSVITDWKLTGPFDFCYFNCKKR